MKYLLHVWLIASALTIALAQEPVMTKGVSVQMAGSNNAIAFPAADRPEAWIVAVTADGQLFFGVNPVTAESLVQNMKTTPRNREAKLYIKADGRAPFAAVKQALHAAHENLFETAVLLTEQTQHTSEGQIVPPQGLEVRLGLPSARATLVQLHNSDGPVPALKVNDREIPWDNLQNALQQAQEQKLVVVEAESNLPFADVVKVIDLGRSIGAKVALSLTSL